MIDATDVASVAILIGLITSLMMLLTAIYPSGGE